MQIWLSVVILWWMGRGQPGLTLGKEDAGENYFINCPIVTSDTLSIHVLTSFHFQGFAMSS